MKTLKGRFVTITSPGRKAIRRKIIWARKRTFEWNYGWGYIHDLKEVDGKLTYTPPPTLTKWPMMQIKDNYLSGVIDFNTAKNQLFDYAPHPDAVESNKEVLRSWINIKRKQKR